MTAPELNSHSRFLLGWHRSRFRINHWATLTCFVLILLGGNGAKAQFQFEGGLAGGIPATQSKDPRRTVIAEEIGDGFFLLEASSSSASANQSLSASTQATDSPPTNQPDNQGQSKEETTASEDDTTTTQVLVRFVTKTVSNSTQPSTNHATDRYQSLSTGGAFERETKITDALKKTATIDFSQGASLREFAEMMTDTLGIQVKLDERVLAGELGLDVNEPHAIRGKYSNISARSALHLLLNNVFECPLTYVIKNEVLLITDRQYAADNYLTTRIYPPPFGRRGRDIASIIELIQNTIAPTTWNTVGGAGAISPLQDDLAITQTQEVHEELEDLLCQLERIAGIEHGTTMLRTHHIKDEALLNECVASLASRVNAVLGDRGDPSAKVDTSNGILFVQSSSRPFIIYAEELIEACQSSTAQEAEWCAPFVTAQGITLQGNTGGTTPASGWHFGGGMGMGGMGMGGLFRVMNN
jgi:hypothetical protein